MVTTGLLVNLVTFIVFGIDKHNAKQKRTRFRIVTLLTLSYIGGSIGGLIAMYLFQHKKNQKGLFHSRITTNDYNASICIILLNEWKTAMI